MASQTLTSFRHRVRVLVEIIDDPDEISLATALFQDRGWPSRPPRSAEVPSPPPPGRSWLVLEFRFNGYVKTAPQAAVKRILEAAHRSHLWVRIRYAEVADFPAEMVKIFYIDETAPPWASSHRVIEGILRFLGIVRTTGLVQVPTNTPRSAVRDELARVNLGRPFDPSRYVLRPAAPYREPGQPAPRVPSRTVSIGAMILAVLCGAAATATPGAWRVLPILLGVSLGVPIGWAWAEHWRFPWWLVLGLGWVVILTVGGVGLQAPDRRPQSLLIGSGVVGLLYILGIGALFAFRESGLARERSWLLPLSLTALAPVLVAVGGTFDGEYLHEFQIPADTVSVPGALRLAITLKSLFLALIFLYVAAGIVGWVRYFHGFDEVTRAPLIVTLAAVTMVYLTASIGAGLTFVDGAARDAKAQARAGKSPAEYFGLQGTLQCVHPVNPSIPVYDGPLPSRQPVLSFGTTTTELWVWDPASGRAIGVPLQEVTTTPAVGSPAHC